MTRAHVALDLMLAVAIAAILGVGPVRAGEPARTVPEALTALLPLGVSIVYVDEGKIRGTSVFLKGVANFTDALRKSDRYRNAAPPGVTREGALVQFEFAVFPPTEGILSLSKDRSGLFGTARDTLVVANFVEALRNMAEHKDAKILLV